MIFRAREVLSDCKIALEILEEEQDLQRWRIHWAAAVALIRAVGHVLDKVDGGDPDIKNVASKYFKSWKKLGPAHEIFREFIEKERNNILKEYQFGIHPNEEVGMVIQVGLEPVSGGKRINVGEIFNIGENIYRPLLDSYREGDDARDVLSEAIDWWEIQLDLIDEEVAGLKIRRK